MLKLPSIKELDEGFGSIYPNLDKELKDQAKERAKYNEKFPFVPALEYCRNIPEDQEIIIRDAKGKVVKKLNAKKEVMSCYPNCCFNHRVDMPRLTYEDEERGIYWESDPIEFSEYEEEMVREYENGNFYANNKCRGAGASERVTVRHMAYKYAIENTTPERKCLICVSISVTISKNFTHRIKLILDKIPFVYREKPQSDFPKEIFCRSGGQIIAIPAEEDAFRSYDKVGDVILEEVSSWDKEDDEPVLKAAEPHVFKSGAKIGNLTTPKGKRGYYWTKIFNDDPDFKTKYKKHVINWRRVVCIPEERVVAAVDKSGKEIPFEKINYAEYWVNKDLKLVEKHYRHKYNTNPQYKKWFDNFFKVSIDAFFNFSRPIISLAEIIRLYKEDREVYDQEADNKFLTTGQIALGSDFPEIESSPTDFNRILGNQETESEDAEESDELDF